MNYLQLAQRLARKCRVTGTGPVAIAGQNAEYMRILDFVNEAWMEIQRKHTDWRFMRASAQCTTVQAKATYDPVIDFGLTDFGYWALDYQAGDTFRVYDTAAGITSETFLETWDYDWWRDAYLYGGFRQSLSRPLGVALAPDNSLAFGPIPAAGYTVYGDYYRVPSELVDADDVPTLPAQFHQLIIYAGMKRYGYTEAAPEIYDEGEAGVQQLMRQLEAVQLRRMTLPGAIA
jgi:hypothetical protein